MPFVECRGGAGSSTSSTVREGAARPGAVQLARHGRSRCGTRRCAPSPRHSACCATTAAATAAPARRRAPTRSSGSAATRWRLLDALGLERVRVLRPVQGRHGRPVAGRPRAGPGRAAGARQHRGPHRRARGLGPADRDRAREGMGAIVPGVIERWFTPALPARARRRRWTAIARHAARRPTPEGYVACCAAVRDMDQRDAIASDPGADAGDRRHATTCATPPEHAQADRRARSRAPRSSSWTPPTCPTSRPRPTFTAGWSSTS